MHNLYHVICLHYYVNYITYDENVSNHWYTTNAFTFRRYKPSKFSMDKDLNLRRLNPFKTDINVVRHNFKNQSQQTDLRKHFPGETYLTTSNTMNQLMCAMKGIPIQSINKWNQVLLILLLIRYRFQHTNSINQW